MFSNIQILAASFVLTMLFPFSALAWEARVIAVSDGDTITVEPIQGGERIKIRLYGIDTPESRQPYGSIATGYVYATALYKTIEVEEYDIDRYGRTVGVVILPDGTNLNKELLSLGHAWYYGRYCKQEFCPEWKEVEAGARSAKAGLWSDGEAIAPWEWRKKK